MKRKWQMAAGEVVEMTTPNEINYMCSDMAKSGPFSGLRVWPAFWRTGHGTRNDSVMLQPALKQKSPKGHTFDEVLTRMVQVGEAVEVSAEEFNARPADNEKCSEWAFEKIDIRDWFE